MSPNQDKQTKIEPLVLGIDTGGTYTDGALLAYQSRQVLASQKSLTTKRDLSLGIEAVIHDIRLEDPTKVKLVSISTTLATNAIAEGKRRPVGLLLIGYDPDLIDTFKMAGRFATSHYFYFTGGHDLHGREQAPLDLPAIRAKVDSLKNQVEAIAVSSYFSPLNPEHELRVQELITERCDLPVVLGHQLSTKLGSVERATTAALNASLLAVLKEFIVAVQQAMGRRQIEAPLMVVRGDGTLMSAEFAAQTPVETIHSGPAASAIGGRFLSGLDEALIIDVGGTTTDLALIQQGQVAVSEVGATVGNYKTSVQAANLHSIALGGDSHINLGRDKAIQVGPERVMPLAHLAQRYPQVRAQLNRLAKRSWSQAGPDQLEYWFLLREPRENNLPKSKRSQALIDYLRDGPRPVAAILEQLDLLHVVQLEAAPLLRQEIIGRAGLTPTDLFHADGRYEMWDAEAARLALTAFSRLQFKEPADIVHQVWSQITETLVAAIVTFLSDKPLPPPTLPEDHDLGRWFFYNSLYQSHPHLETSIRLRQPIIGIGAPAALFLPPVAELLHTELILPQYHQVANAVGAIAGSVMVAEELIIYPQLSREGLDVIGYYVQGSNGRQLFETLAKAVKHARGFGQQQVLDAAIRSGAANPQVTVYQQQDGLDTYRIRIEALGNPSLG